MAQKKKRPKRGRPKGPKKETIGLFMRPHIIKALKDAAEAEEVSASEFVERLICRSLGVSIQTPPQ